MGKSRVAPIKNITTPRMELVSATSSVKISALLQKELQLLNVKEIFWTDSEVLGYIRNESKKFKVFVANRIEMIRDHTAIRQWHYIGTKDNPADYSSRGIDVANNQAVQNWFRGLSLLWKPEVEWTIQDNKGRILQNDPEIKKCLQINCISTENDTLEALESRISSWYNMKRVVAMVLRYKKLLKKIRKGESQGEMINSSLLKEAEIEIIKMAQARAFDARIKSLRPRDCSSDGKGRLKGNSKISQLDLFLDEDCVLCVGGRLRKSYLNDGCKHPVLLPKEERVTLLIMQWCHSKCAHGGRGLTLNELRSWGYWVICGNVAVKNMIFHCVQCRRLCGRLVEQEMASLPYCRVAEAPPFTFCGVDMFGTFIIKQRRSQVKYYGAMFTCMSCRAVHIEITHSLDTDSFIRALRRLIDRRGSVQTIFSDNCSNFIGSENGLMRALEEMDKEKLQHFMQASGGDWTTWKRNPSYGSHMGGVWERQIRSARSILSSLMQTDGRLLDEESLATLMAETEGFLNS